MTRRGLAIAVLGAIVAGGIWAVVRWLAPSPSDTEQIRALFSSAAKAAEEKRIGDVVDGLSERFVGEGLDKQGVKRLVAVHLLRGDWVSITLTEPKIEVNGDAADAVVDVIMARSGAGGLAGLLPADATANRFTCKLVREAEGWRIVRAERRVIGAEELLDGAPAPK